MVRISGGREGENEKLRKNEERLERKQMMKAEEEINYLSTLVVGKFADKYHANIFANKNQTNKFAAKFNSNTFAYKNNTIHLPTNNIQIYWPKTICKHFLITS